MVNHVVVGLFGEHLGVVRIHQSWSRVPIFELVPTPPATSPELQVQLPASISPFLNNRARPCPQPISLGVTRTDDALAYSIPSDSASYTHSHVVELETVLKGQGQVQSTQACPQGERKARR